MIIDLSGAYIEGLTLINPNRQFSVSDRVYHYYIDLDDGTITKTEIELESELEENSYGQ